VEARDVRAPVAIKSATAKDELASSNSSCSTWLLSCAKLTTLPVPMQEQHRSVFAIVRDSLVTVVPVVAVVPSVSLAAPWATPSYSAAMALHSRELAVPVNDIDTVCAPSAGRFASSIK